MARLARLVAVFRTILVQSHHFGVIAIIFYDDLFIVISLAYLKDGAYLGIPTRFGALAAVMYFAAVNHFFGDGTGFIETCSPKSHLSSRMSVLSL